MNILLIDFNKKETTLLENIFSKNNFTYKFIKLGDNSPSENNWSIILFKHKKNSDPPWEKLSSIQNKLGTPISVISSMYKPEFYFSGISKGIYHYINMPIDEKSLIEHIQEIIKLNQKSTASTPIELNFTYENELYKIEIPDNKLINSIVSLLNNAIRSEKLLVHYIKNKGSLEKENTFSKEDRDMIAEMEKALENREFQLYYQPVMDLSSDRLYGFESLVRWIHPEKGIIPPDSFIPLSEKTDFIIPLSYWIIEEAIRQKSEWETRYNIPGDIRLNINLSARQFLEDDLFESIMAIFKKFDIKHENIVFEITESAFITDMKKTNLILLQLKSENFKIYMDDFGTGYSSLAYLQHFPIDTLKIDKSFVEWMHIDEQSEQIVRSVIALAHNLNMTVVAEGIEEEEHIKLLKSLGCNFGQGYYYSKPLDSANAEEFIKKFI